MVQRLRPHRLHQATGQLWHRRLRLNAAIVNKDLLAHRDLLVTMEMPEATERMAKMRRMDGMDKC